MAPPWFCRIAQRLCGSGRPSRDAFPIHGLCDGVAPDGTLIVAGKPIFAGEAHILTSGDINTYA